MLESRICSAAAASKLRLSREDPGPLLRSRPFHCIENNAKILSPKGVSTGSMPRAVLYLLAFRYINRHS